MEKLRKIILEKEEVIKADLATVVDSVFKWKNIKIKLDNILKVADELANYCREFSKLHKSEKYDDELYFLSGALKLLNVTRNQAHQSIERKSSVFV